MPESYFEDATITITATLKAKKFLRTKPYSGPVKLSFFKATETAPFFTSTVNAVDGKIDKPFKHKLPLVDKKEESYDLRVTCEYKKVNLLLLTATIWPKEAKVSVLDEADKKLPNFEFLVKQAGIDDQKLATDGEGKCNITLMARKPYNIAPALNYRVLEKKQATPGQFREDVLKVKTTITARFESPIVTEDPYIADPDAAPAVKQWVNLTSAEAVHTEGHGCDAKGSIVAFTVTANPVEEGKKDDKVYFEVTLGKESKRNDPLPAVLGDLPVFDRKTTGNKITGHVKLDAEGGKASFEVNLGIAGGDTCEVKIGGTEAVADAKLKLINWRKMYAQVTKLDTSTAPSLDKAKACLKKMFIDFEESTADNVDLDESEAPAGAIVDGAMIATGAPAKALIVGDHNVTALKAKLKPRFKSENLPCAHLIYCDFQLDGNNVNMNLTTTLKGKKTGQVQSTVAFPGGGTVPGFRLGGDFSNKNGLFFAKDLRDGTDAVKSCTWAEDGGTGSGTVPATDYKIDQPANGNFFYVRLPAAAKALSDAGKTIKVSYEVAWAKGWYNGWCTGVGRHLVIKTGRPDADICGTVVHEVGHAISQAPDSEAAFPGLPKPPHERYYTNNRGHQGGHCADGIDATTYDDVSIMLDTAHASSKCTCIMYGAGAALRNSTMAFCSKCEPYVKAAKIAKVSE